jgi:hypothetical protein
MSKDIAEEQSIAPATIFTGGGPLMGLIRKVYCQIRLSLPSDPDLRDRIKQVFNQPHPSLDSNDGDTSLKDAIDNQYASLRASYNRFHFVHSNFFYFHPDHITRSEMQYQAEKANFTDHRDSKIKKAEKEFEKILNRQRYAHHSFRLTKNRKPHRYPNCRFVTSFISFLLLLVFGLYMFTQSIVDSKCISESLR